ncbi:MAG: YdcF family protein [Verrucomicrobia bacterium]|nr:YdcF family protein [Verrucomicrobiota bacterium]
MKRFLKRLALGLLLLCVFGSVLYWLRAPILRGVATAWIVDDPLTKADVIIVLGGGPSTRPFEAARLYHQRLAPQILLMQPRADSTTELGLTKRESELLKQILLKQDVPEPDILIAADEVSSTYEEALAVRNWVGTNHIQTAIVVTDVFHARRVRWVFRKQLRHTGVRVLVRALPVREYTTENWWQREQGVAALQSEVLKYAYYRVKY